MGGGFAEEREELLKRRWQDRRLWGLDDGIDSDSNGSRRRRRGVGDDEDMELSIGRVVPLPAVTVVLEGRSICQRISLDKHCSYQSLAVALRHMFADASHHSLSSTSSSTNLDHNDADADTHLDLSNAVPGHLIAYEDMENDLLLVGDLNWNDFVRVAKRIRILPVKPNSRKRRGGAAP
ncbi:hypothetical protein NMG60_11019006 [Bertholletia excelsa]